MLFTIGDDIQGLLNKLWDNVDTALEEHNIDMTSCLQKTICTRVNRLSMQTAKSGKAEETTMEKILIGLKQEMIANKKNNQPADGDMY